VYREGFVSRKKSIIIGIGLALIITTITILLLPKEPSLEQVAVKFRDCALTGNGGCVRSLLTSEELKDNPASAEQISEMLNRFVRPILKGNPEPFEKMGLDEMGWLTFSCALVAPDRHTGFSVTVAKTNEGVKVIDGLSSLITLAAQQKEGKPAAGNEKFGPILKVLPLWIPELKELNINGSRIRPTNEFMNWDEYLSRLTLASKGAPPKENVRLRAE
jgi:hypothetical protein